MVVELLKRCFDYQSFSSGAGTKTGTIVVSYLAVVVNRRSSLVLVLVAPCSTTVNDFIVLSPLLFALVSFDIYTFLTLLDKGLVKWYVSSVCPCCHMIQHHYRYSVALSAPNVRIICI